MEEARLVHEELLAIARVRQQLHVREAALLVRAEALEIWRMFGCATFFEYLERFCDLQPRTAREYLRVARALTELPLIRGELEGQRIVYSTARELTRIATAQTEAAWLAAVERMSPREIEEEIAGRERGDRPRDDKDPDRLVPLVLRVRESTFALFVERRTHLGDEVGERLTDDELLVALCRPELESGTAPYQTAITTCRTCAKSYRVAGGREVVIPASLLEMVQCDARHLGDLESDERQRLTATVTPRVRKQVIARDRYMCCVPGCRSKRHLDLHHIVAQANGGSHKPSNLVTLCGAHHRQLHEGKLTITGTAPLGLVFAWPAEPTRSSARAR